MNPINWLKIQIIRARTFRAHKELKEDVMNMKDAFGHLQEMFNLTYGDDEITDDSMKELKNTLDNCHMQCSSLLNRLDQYDSYMAEGDEEKAEYVFSFAMNEYGKLEKAMDRLQEVVLINKEQIKGI